MMRHVGTLSNGNYLVEMTPEQWRDFALLSEVAPADLGGRVLQCRKALRLTQAEMAQRVGVSRNYLAQIERGQADNISLAVYRRLIAEVGNGE